MENQIVNLGTVAQYKVAGGTTRLNTRFAAGKQGQLTFLDAKGQQMKLFGHYDKVTLSKAVSDDLRVKKITLSNVMTLNALVNPLTDVVYISYPEGAGISIANDSYAITAIIEVAVAHEDLIAL